jgi:O-antigen/teichoic acid export membrane protein
MILSRVLTKYEYGTYAQGVLIVSLATTFVGFGANNAANYFYNKTDDMPEKSSYINTIFFLEFILGFLGSAILIVSGGFIADYFKNPQLTVLVFAVALRPLFANMILIYQTLYISSQMTKAIAFRNLLVSFCQVAVTSLVSLLLHNILLIFILLSALDLLQILAFSTYFKRKVFHINPFHYEYDKVKPILSYALPMAVALMLGTLLINMDNLFIGKLMSTEDLALYSNMSKELPFAFIGGTFTTVFTPAVIRMLSSGKKEEFCVVWSNYIQLGYLTTWTFCAGAVVCAPELLRFLYSDKYISGLNVFIVYIIIQMFRFTYFGMILTAKGKTKTILLYSFTTLAVNFILNIILFHFMGMVGCAFASLISISVIGMAQMFHGAKMVRLPLTKVLRLDKMLIFLAGIAVVSAACFAFKQFLYSVTKSNVVILLLTYAMFLALCLKLNMKSIKEIIKNLENDGLNGRSDRCG